MVFIFSKISPLQPLLPTATESIVSNSFTLAASLGSIFVNIFSIAVIKKNKNLHSTCFFLIGLHGIATSQMSLGFCTRAILSLCRIEFMSRLQCSFAYLFSLASASPTTAMLPCAIAVDRFIGIALPVQYKRISKIFLKAVAGLCIFFACLHPIVTMITIPGNFKEQVLCVSIISVQHPAFPTYQLCYALVFYTVSVISYAFMEGLIRFRRHKINPSTTATTNSPQERFIAQQMSLLPVIKTLLIAYILLAVTVQIVITAAPYVDNGRHQVRIMLHAAILRSSLGLVDFIVLVVKCTEFRKTVQGFWKWNTTVSSNVLVQPMGTA